jgi:S1-C subfamily serine protease
MGTRTASEQPTIVSEMRRFIRRCVAAVLLAVSACSSTSSTPADGASTDVFIDASDPSSGTDPASAVSATSDPAISGTASGVGVLAVGCGPAASAGSGVALEAPGQVVTVAHTVAGATSITVVAADGTEFDARVVAFDPDADLAVLAVGDLTAPPLAVGSVQLGDATLVSWSTDSGVGVRPLEVTQRLAITIDDIYGSDSVERSGFEIAGDIVVGDSGGPVVSPDGDVIGIVYARSRSRASTAFATGADEITALLAGAGDEPVDNGTCV